MKFRPRMLMLVGSALFLCAVSTGCQLVGNGARNVCAEFSRDVEDRREHRRNLAWAEAAWQDVQAHNGYLSVDYGHGFRGGFVDFIEKGGDKQPPPVPPKRYWAVRYQSPDGYQAIKDWYTGFHHGATVAAEGDFRKWVIVPPGVAPGLPAALAAYELPVAHRPPASHDFHPVLPAPNQVLPGPKLQGIEPVIPEQPDARITPLTNEGASAVPASETLTLKAPASVSPETPAQLPPPVAGTLSMPSADIAPDDMTMQFPPLGAPTMNSISAQPQAKNNPPETVQKTDATTATEGKTSDVAPAMPALSLSLKASPTVAAESGPEVLVLPTQAISSATPTDRPQARTPRPRVLAEPVSGVITLPAAKSAAMEAAK